MTVTVQRKQNAHYEPMFTVQYMPDHKSSYVIIPHQNRPLQGRLRIISKRKLFLFILKAPD